jgi:hypothetical protein
MDRFSRKVAPPSALSDHCEKHQAHESDLRWVKHARPHAWGPTPGGGLAPVEELKREPEAAGAGKESPVPANESDPPASGSQREPARAASTRGTGNGRRGARRTQK